VRARIEVTKPPLRFIALTVAGIGRKRLAVKYEKLPFFCKQCGLLGHNHEECEDGVWDEKQFQYGEWMLAKRRVSQPTSEPRRFFLEHQLGVGLLEGGWATKLP
jgi:hypothetical protein